MDGVRKRMIVNMIYECTDCTHCADFEFGFRVICLEPTLPPDEVCKYFPVGDKDAENCNGFDDRQADDYCTKVFFIEDFTAAEDYSTEVYGEITYQGLREWIEKKIRGEL
jgi:hypothetical protein